MQKDKQGLYQAIFSRRDIRSQFTSQPVDENTLAKILMAAHSAPSVGFMQPWNFLLVKDQEIKEQVYQSFLRCFDAEAECWIGERAEQYKRLKLEGIYKAPINLCVTCDRSRSGPFVLGRNQNKEMDLYSTVCAIQNLWLAARAEGVGVGWVSIVDHQRLKDLFHLPNEVEVVAYLCLGYVDDFPDKPELETLGWLPQLALKDLVFHQGWNKGIEQHWPDLVQALEKDFKDL